MITRRETIGLVAFLAACFGVAFIGSLATGPAIPEWYASLRKPAWNPPNWLFGPVWTVLYAMMAVAAWRVWRKEGFRGARWALAIFFVQLALNMAWTFIFFGAHSPGGAFLEIVILWALILMTAALFRRHDAAAGWMLLPYLLWVGFAAVLNFAIWRLNC